MSQRRTKAELYALVACASALTWGGPAQAQDATPRRAASEIQEVIVTARKRQESILNVPVIATVLPQEQLERLQARELRDIIRFVPGLNFGTGVGLSGVQFSVRGIGTTTSDPSIEQTVALNIDGVQMYQGLAYMTGMFDVGQVEVLKGPQALFYGKSAPGGVISIRTADPTDRFELISRVGYEFEAREKRAELIVSGRVADGLKVRLAGMYAQEAGYFRNAALFAPGTGALPRKHDRAPRSKRYILRTTVLWEPASNFSSRLKVSLNNDRIDHAGIAQFAFCPDGAGAPAGIPFLGGGEDCKPDRTIRLPDMDPAAFPFLGDRALRMDSNQKYGSLELNWRPRPEITVTSMTGIYHNYTSNVFLGVATAYAGPTILVVNDYGRTDKTQEFRLNTEFAGPLNATVGALYQDSKFDFATQVSGNQVYRFPLRLSDYTDRVGIKATSVFGQLRWNPVEKLEIAIGARWTDEKRTIRAVNRVTGIEVPVALGSPRIRSKATQPELTITYKPADDVTIFGSLKKGYKSGSFNTGVVPTPGANVAFGDESVKGGEVGIKSRLLERRLSLELAAYDYRYTGLQVGAIEPAPGGIPQTRTVNAGSARTYGLDFSAAYRPPQVEGLDLYLNGAWTKARFKKLDRVPCWGGQTIAEGCSLFLNPVTGLFTAQNLNGLPLPRAPRWQLNFGFNYERPLADKRTLVLSNNTAYFSRYLVNLGKRSDFFQPGFIRTDLSVALRGAEERWEVALVGKNITDKLIKGNCSSSNYANGSLFGGQITGGTARGIAGIDELACRMDRGREIWVRLTLKPFN